MTDKVQKIREEVEKLRKSYQIMYQELDCESPEYMSVCAKLNLCQDILMFIDSMQEEPVSKDKFTFTSLPRLLDRIKPTDRVEWYSSRLADALEEEGYITDAKIVRESIKIMNGEKVPMATMDEEPVSEDLEKVVEEIVEPTILNAYGTKELARRLRNTICGTPVSEDLEEASKEWLRPQLDKSYANYGEAKMMELTHFDGYAMLDAIEFGAEWQKAKDESTTEDLGEYINELSKQFPEVSFAKLSRISVRVAKWQKQQIFKAMDLGEPPYLISVEQAYYNVKKMLKED